MESGSRLECGRLVLLAVGLAALVAPARGGDFSVVINEIHYHPGDDTKVGEFVELANAGTEPVDLGGWWFEEGIDFTFPDGTVIGPGEFLVVASDAARIRTRYGITNVTGNFDGTLENQGERIALYNDGGYLISAVAYGDDKPWPSTPDGLGPSLERISPLREEDDPGSWEASIIVGGTPGRKNSIHRQGSVDDMVQLVSTGAQWRYFKGTREPSNPITEWTEIGFNDGGWLTGDAGFGYGDADDATVLSDMEDGYLSVYIRKTFTVDDPSIYQSLLLSISYDDGFVAYLNGQEIARAAMDGDPPAFDDEADGSHEADGFEDFAVAGGGGMLVAGTNVLAVQGHNHDLGSSDLTLHPALSATKKPADPPPERPARDIVINEVAPGEGDGGWVELYNAGEATVSLAGLELQLYPPSAGRAALGNGDLAPGAFLVIDEASLPFALDPVLPNLILATSDGVWKDALNPRTVAADQSSGLYPDGVDDRYALVAPTRGAPNELSLDARIVISEIMYHPAATGTQYIEIFNRSAEPVELTGWAFTRGLTYAFDDGTTIGAGAYLVIAEDPATVEAHYGISGVHGPWVGGLANDGETVTLRDGLRNPADEVRYADDGLWPPEADGAGPSLELLNVDAENDAATAWAASAGDGTPGAPNSKSAGALPPIITDCTHAPLLPGPGEPVIVAARVAVFGGLREARVYWRADGSTATPSSALLHDDGLAGDAHAGDGLYSARLSGAADNAIRTFWIRAEDGAGRTAMVPPNAPETTLLYEVDGSPPTVERPLYRIIMTAANWNTLRTRSIYSDVLLDATFLDGERAYYNVGIRYRGNGARQQQRKSYRVEFSHDRPFIGMKRLNLNAWSIERQWYAADIMTRAGIPTPTSWFRELTINGQPQGLLLRVEAVDGQFLEEHFPGDDDGNLYRGYDQARFDYRGTDPTDYEDDYQKKTHEEANDFSDIIDLCDRFSRTSDAHFPARIEEVIDVEQWLRFLAAYVPLAIHERCLATDGGDEYFIYRRPSDGRFVLIPWDFNETFDSRETSQVLFRPTVPAIVRLLQHAYYAPTYLCGVEDMMAGAFAEEVALGRIEAMRGLFAEAVLQGLRTVVPARRAYIESQLRRDLVVTVAGDTSMCGSEGLVVTGDHADLSGIVPGCGTSFVEVNGTKMPLDPVTGDWSASVALQEGLNEIEVRCLDRYDGQILLRTVPITRVASVATLSGTIAADRHLSAGEGPFLVAGTARVAAGVTLTIGPGTEVLFRTDGSLVVDGTLSIEGDASARVRIGPAACDGRWLGIDLRGGGTHTIAFCDMTGATASPNGPAAVSAVGGTLTIRSSTFTHMDKGIDVQGGGRLILEDSLLEDTEEAVHLNGSTATLRRVTIRHIRGANDAIDLDNDGPEPSLIEDCQFSDGDDDAIDTMATTLTVRRTVIHDMVHKGLSLEAPSDVTVDHVLIYRTGEG
ncbi:MAG: lamin tail domain-containing protein, partial [Planctomycetes bacterium]|nr:lamin tail domain-containing protein [Planctomycetota bacterium]